MDSRQTFSPEQKERLKVLVVEDNLLNQKLDSYILTNWGLRHDICANGQIAVDKLRATEFYDIILMDIQMPVLNGYEATRVIRGELQLDVPIIGITAHANPAEKQKCLEAGMSYYITKPINEEELHRLMTACFVGAHNEKIKV
jgi:CheY-like chemotaxis protein